MLRTNYRCVQSLNISVDVAKCVGNVHTLIHYSHFWTVTKNDLSSLNNLFMERFLLNRMSSSVRDKLQMCSVNQHQCRRRQMFGKCSQIQTVHSLFVRCKKRLVLIEQSIHGNGFNSLECPLMLRKNYRCVQSLNISVDDAKCVDNVHTLIQSNEKDF